MRCAHKILLAAKMKVILIHATMWMKKHYAILKRSGRVPGTVAAWKTKIWKTTV
jgi:hypothetical protein